MKKVLYALMFCGLIAMGGCNKKEDPTLSYTSIDCEKKEELMNSGALLIDVREPNEYADFHLENAVNRPSTKILSTIENEIIKEAPIVLYCASGNRSKNIAEELVKLGYSNVYDMGSINACIKEVK